jgi:hypothetical protein
METKVARINRRGLEQIAEALGQHHKLGRAHFTPAMLHAWAADAEASFDAGNGCGFEIRSFESVTGAPVEVRITDDGFDVEELFDV